MSADAKSFWFEFDLTGAASQVGGVAPRRRCPILSPITDRVRLRSTLSVRLDELGLWT